MDEIRIENLEVYAGHGVYEEENRKGQTFFVNVIMYTDVKEAGSRDELSLSTNYGEVCHKIHTCLRENTFQLIEAVAEFTAEQILLAFPLIQALSLEIRKPDAPVGLPFESVSVKICRGWKKAYLAVGSNMGEKAAYIKEAVEKLVQNPKIRKVRMSELLVTKPYGGVEQDDFLNGAIELETLYTPMELLEFLQQTEAEAGRERLVHWGPRTLDLDILFYENQVIFDTDVMLFVPHPRIPEREFVLKPLSYILPDFIHPQLQKSVTQLYRELMRKKAKVTCKIL